MTLVDARSPAPAEPDVAQQQVTRTERRRPLVYVGLGAVLFVAIAATVPASAALVNLLLLLAGLYRLVTTFR